MSEEEKNKEVARKLFENAWDEGDLSAVDECIAEDFYEHDTIGEEEPLGVEGKKKNIRKFRDAFSDFEVAVEDLFAAEGNKVVIRFRVNGTHTGDFVGVSPTGESWEGMGIEIVRFEDGKMVESWANFDALGMLQQLDVVPEDLSDQNE
jgi:steroid delta-isomerase-like uncharacterized protein